VGAAFLGGLVIARVTRFMDTHSSTRIAIAFAVIVVLAVLAVGLVRLRSREWFHPFAFPFVYVSLTLLLPVLYLVGTQRTIGAIQPEQVSSALVGLFLLVIAGMAIGTGASMALAQRKETTESAPLNYAAILRAGRWLIGLGIIWRVWQLPSALELPYGYGSVNYSMRAAILTIVNGLFFIAVIFTVLANSQRGLAILSRFDLGLVAIFASLTLITGSRGSLVAPALFILWGYHTFQRRIALWQGLVAAALIVSIVTFVGIHRSGEEVKLEKDQLASPALGPISTPALITSILLERVPSRYPFEHGGTYLAALQRQLPGPVSRVVLGPPQQTGTFVFRRIIRFTNVNAGFAFSLPSEAYLNFGAPGTLVAGLLLGSLLGFAYRKHVSMATRPLHMLYPILISLLPLGIRSDAVFQIKSVLYVMIALMVVHKWVANPHATASRVRTTP